jgi:hypothetical protein
MEGLQAAALVLGPIAALVTIVVGGRTIFRWITRAEEREEEARAQNQDRPAFERVDVALSRREAEFAPSWRIRQASGDYVPNIEWRFRGPRFDMQWRSASGSALERTNISAQFDLSRPPRGDDDRVGADEIGLEVRYHWRGHWWHELHKWPLTRTEHPAKALWDIGEEVLPPISWREDSRRSPLWSILVARISPKRRLTE